MSTPRNKQRLLPVAATFWRGGTSKGLFFNRDDLPADREEWKQIFLGAMGSPDHYGRQLDGMGGGLSSLSKVVVLERSSRPDVDVDYTFVQIGIRNDDVDYASMCGNLAAAVGPAALEMGLLEAADPGLVRFFNTNTRKTVHSRFQTGADGRLEADGGYSIDGVSGAAARITLDFIEPGGSKTGSLLPTGQVIDQLSIDDGGEERIEASLIDCGNPCIFLSAASLGLKGDISPDQLSARPALLNRLEAIRQSGGLAMRTFPSQHAALTTRSVPKVCIVSPISDSNRVTADLIVRTISTGDPHRAIPITAALATAAAAKLDGSIVQRCISGKSLINDAGLSISHPSGVINVNAAVQKKDGTWHAEKATIYSTARKLFSGTVYSRVQADVSR